MSDALSEEFFAEVGDKYYPQVMEGLERLGAGDVADGIALLSRPLHTIKGVTGFMPGFEAASSFTHKVESFLKKLQAGSLPHSSDNISLAAFGVNSIFAAIEQIRVTGAPDQGEIDAVCEVLAAASSAEPGPAQPGADRCVAVEQDQGRTVLRITAARIHRKAQRDQMVGAVLGQPQETPLVLDLSGVKTFGSAAWEDLAQLTEHWSISVRGLCGAARETFHAGDMDAHFAVLPPEQTEQAARADGDAP